ncbi:TPA: FecCD family ABC transporter permease [Vibrio cholerae]|uniref:FecCD family ABC transporter permease n=1 Tax=Vibrio cholerae TaxID=666 RepID=UPI00019F6F23|nr:iron ABC transporter permease [Vibrio cholerae]EEO14931.1 ferric vibriobactin enterobactin transport system permease protein ViuD [Vibrio cholerae TMA 21]EGR4134816.1 iron ABC transporter permease [Vibrio cholerae]EGR4424820.1 iron ABC transporter permease [Vibrio cholerae]
MNEMMGIRVASSKRENPTLAGRDYWLMGLMLVALMGLTISSVFVGSRDIPYAVTFDALFHFDEQNTQHLLVHYLRVPRTGLAILVGAALGAAGVIMQAMTRNPLADPGILGVNAGAILMVVIGIAGFGLTDMLHYLWFGLFGAAATSVGVYLLAGINQSPNPVRVVLAGAAMTVMLLSMTHLIMLNSAQEVFNQFRHWSVGSLQGRGYEVLLPTSVFVLLGLIAAILLARGLDTVVLGHDAGKALGVNPLWIWIASATVVTLLAGTATAAAGPISFLGLTAPHLARLWVGAEHRRLLPYSMLLGALLLLGADLAGRLIGSNDEISAGIMVALIGGPVFVLLVRRWKLSHL